MGATSGGVGSLAVDNGSDGHPDGRDRGGSCWLLGIYIYVLAVAPVGFD